MDNEKKNYLFLFVASQIEIVKFLNDYVNYESQSSGRLMGCELTSSDALAVGIGIWGGAISGGLFGTIVGGGILSVPAGIAGFIGGALSGAIVGGATLAVQKAIECSK